MSSCRWISMRSAASSSFARLDEFRHVCWSQGVQHVCSVATRQKKLTSNWLYSFSKRCNRRAGSFAKSFRELAEDSGVCARRRDHCEVPTSAHFPSFLDGIATYKVHGVSDCISRCTLSECRPPVVVAELLPGRMKYAVSRRREMV